MVFRRYLVSGREVGTMKVLLITSMFPPYCSGGVSSHVSDLADALARSGANVWVLTSRRGKAPENGEESGGPSSTNVVVCKDFAYMLPRLRRLIEDIDFDVVHYHSFNTLGFAFANLADSTATIFTIHSDTANYIASLRGWSGRFHPAYAFLRLYERVAIRAPDTTIAVSRRLQEYALSIGAREVSYVPNAVDCEFWLPEERNSRQDGPAILVPRMLVPKNGIEHAIRAMKAIREVMPQATMRIAGDGPLRSPLENLAATMGGNSIQFLGDVPRPLMRTLYQSADLVLIPSITSSGVQEATSIAALEAMACGRAVIASDIGGLPEIIQDGRDGFLVPEKDSVAIAETVTTLYGDEQVLRQVAVEARKKVLRDFSIPAWITRTIDSYSMAANRM